MSSVELEVISLKSYTDFIFVIILALIFKKVEWEGRIFSRKKTMLAIEKGHAKEI